ncbi:hypothetical protein HanIR_Chr14g0709431 [Helianthus annuus]|nr:hypothetical protein HanIR_Chr14g0709431 [Helianthus annuus]
MMVATARWRWLLAGCVVLAMTVCWWWWFGGVLVMVIMVVVLLVQLMLCTRFGRYDTWFFELGGFDK